MERNELFNIGVKALIVDRKKRILVLRAGAVERRFVKRDFWDLPGGRIKSGEEMLTTLRREVREELGVPRRALKIGDLCGIVRARFRIAAGSPVALMLVIYRCRLPSRVTFKLSPEHCEWKWAPPREAQRLLGAKFPRGFLKRLRYMAGDEWN